MYNGFSSVHEYERECERLGFQTERIQFCDDSFILITHAPETKTSVDCWVMFDKNENVVTSGVINGVDKKLDELLGR